MNKYFKAAEEIEKYGWTKRKYGDRSIGYCMLGALREYNTYGYFNLSSLYKVLDGNDVVRANDVLFESETEVIISLSLAGCIEDER